MSRARAAALGLVFLAGCEGDCRAFGPSEEEQKEALVRMVQSSQKEGIAERDTKAFMRIWADDAELINARTERPGPYDVLIPIAKLERAQEIRFASPADAEVRIRFRDESVHLEADRALLRWTTVSTSEGRDGGDIREEIAEWFRLEREGERWQVVENRYWLVARRMGETVLEYDEQFYRARDEEVEAARKSGDRMSLLRAQIVARQLMPALELARAITADEPDNLEAWQSRAWLASYVQEVEEALAAYRRIRSLDSAATIPAWVR